MAITNWTRRTQETTRANASRNGEGWTTRDVEFVVAFANEATDAEIAIAMGRTLYAIQTLRHAIDAGKTVGSQRRVTASYRGWMEGDEDA